MICDNEKQTDDAFKIRPPPFQKHGSNLHNNLNSRHVHRHKPATYRNPVMKTRLNSSLRNLSHNIEYAYAPKRNRRKRDCKFYCNYLLTCKWYEKLKRNQNRKERLRRKWLYRDSSEKRRLYKVDCIKNRDYIKSHQHHELPLTSRFCKTDNNRNLKYCVNYSTAFHCIANTQPGPKAVSMNKDKPRAKNYYNLSLVRCISVHNLQGSMDIEIPLNSTSYAPSKGISSNTTESTIHKVLANIFFCCLRSKQTKGAKFKSADDTRGRHFLKSCTQADVPVMDLFKKTTNDFACQYGVRSNQSIEITSHMLSKPTSQSSSLASILKGQKLQKSKKRSSGVLQVMMYSIAKKLKDKPSKTQHRNKRHNVVILPVPRKFSRSPTEPIAHSTKLIASEKPLLIRNRSSEDEDENKEECVVDSNKIWSPGEIVLTVLKLKESGRVRHVGVSNLNVEQLKRISNVAKPACLQIEIHVLCQQPALVEAANELGVPIVAYSPLGSKGLADMKAAQSGQKYPDLLQLAEVQSIAQKHGRTPAQVLLRYNLQRGLAAIPKSTNPIRIKQNISVWDFCLSVSEINELAALDLGEKGRVCDFTFFIGAEKHPEFPFNK